MRPWKQAPLPDLEIARAREIWGTYCINKDKENLLKLVKGSREWFDDNGVRRIHAYVLQLRDGEIE